MNSMRPKEEFDSLDSQNVEALTNDVKIVCPVLDNVDNIVNNTECNSDYLKDFEERDQSLSQETNNESSFDKISRRPVETWKYLPFTSDCNRTSYKCSVCCSVYQHKKSLNKHWKDKHHSNSLSDANSMPFQEIIPSNIMINDSPKFQNPDAIIFPSNNQPPFCVKREMFTPQVLVSTSDACPPFDMNSRKRLSLQMEEFDENKENYPTLQTKRMSLVPMQSFIFRHNRLLCDSNRRDVQALPFPGGSSTKTVDSEALDLRTSKLFNRFQINFRCFQCVFHTNNIVELNEHFRHLHMSILIGIKSFCLPISIYQKLLLNQFTAIVRTESEPLHTFNGPIRCCLCRCLLPTRYDMIQHLGLSHPLEMIWACLVCGFGCQFPTQLSQHFRCHSEIKMLTKVTAVGEPSVNSINSSMEFPSPKKPDSYLATSTPNNKLKRVVSRKDPSSSDNCSVKEKVLKCLVCDATARWRSELFTHMITHSEHRSFGCKFCSYRSKWKWDVPKHLKRCRMAPPAVRKPDVQNSYLITLLQYYSPPTGDILYEFMKQYNIKDIGSINKQIDIKLENEENIQIPEQSSSNANVYQMCESETIDLPKDHEMSKSKRYDIISIVSEEEGDLDVGTDHFFDYSIEKSQPPLRSLFKKCPWCHDFLTNKPTEMSSHLDNYHPDDVFSG